MFERFTDRARRVLVLAQEEARLLNHSFIGTEHLLLGLLAERENIAAKALESMGVARVAVRQRVAATVGVASSPPMGGPPFTPRAKKVLELSLREALRLGHNYIGAEHLLLGLVSEGEGVGAEVLIDLGADLPRVRQQVLRLLVGTSDDPGEDGTSRATAHLVAATHGASRSAAGVADESISIQLGMDNRQLLGTAHGEQVRLDLGNRSHDMTVTGTFAGASVDVKAVLDDNSLRPTGLSARLHGFLDDQPVELRFGFDLEASYRFHHGEVRGVVAGAPIEARVQRSPGPSSKTVSILGTWDANLVGLEAHLSGDLRTGHVYGAIGDATVRLLLTNDRQDDQRSITISGTWGGPLASLALAIGVMLHFM